MILFLTPPRDPKPIKKFFGLNGKPQTRDIKLVLKEWLSFRTQTVTRRLQYRLDWVLDRLHILEGLLVVFINIDEVNQVTLHPKVNIKITTTN